MIKGSGWRGDKIMDEAKAQSLRDKVNEVASSARPSSPAARHVPDGPSRPDFSCTPSARPATCAEMLAPAQYLKGVPGLRDFFDGLRDGEFPGKSKSEIRDELLLRIDR